MHTLNRVSIIGMGALGILYGHQLTKALGPDAVRFVSNQKRINRFKSSGVTCNGEPCNFSCIEQDEPCEPADLIIFAVKAPSLSGALASARNQVGPNTIILSLLNGISSEEIISQAFGSEHIIYCVAQGMDAVKLENALTFTQMGTLCIGHLPGEPEKKSLLTSLSDLFERTNIPYIIEEDILHRMWAKFMLNVGVNQTVMVFETTYGGVQIPGKPRDLMLAAMREVLLIANCKGVSLTEKDIESYLNLLNTLSADKMPSMRQDGLAKRPSEVDLFAGTVIQLASSCGIAVPANEFLYSKIKEMEAAY